MCGRYLWPLVTVMMIITIVSHSDYPPSVLGFTFYRWLCVKIIQLPVFTRLSDTCICMLFEHTQILLVAKWTSPMQLGDKPWETQVNLKSVMKTIQLKKTAAFDRLMVPFNSNQHLAKTKNQRSGYTPTCETCDVRYYSGC